MATPRTKNQRSSLADRSRTLACVPWRIALIALILTVVFNPRPSKAQTVTLQTGPPGATITGGTNIYNSNFGNMNALGVNGANANGLTPIVANNGALYYTPIKIRASGMNAGRTGTLTAYVSTNFTRTAVASVQVCPYNLACTASSEYSALSTSVAAQTSLGPAGIANNTSVTAGLAIFLPDNNGAGAFAGTNTVTITFTLLRSGGGTDTCTLTITLVSQTAVQLTLSSSNFAATGSSPDYTVNFGNVNGLGIGATFPTTSVPGGIVYTTSYTLLPAFAELSSTTATIKVQETSPFQYPLVLILEDATASTGPFTPIPVAPAGPVTLTTTAADRASIPRYLGLFVSSGNGQYPAKNFINVVDTATLTFTLTVP